MNEAKQVLQLTEQLLIGRGAHKEVYYHPSNKKLCVKLLYVEPDVDLERELYYRKIRDKRKQESVLLPKYYGTVATNKGTGYLFELVCDYNGKSSITLKDYLTIPPPMKMHLYLVLKNSLNY